MQSFVYHVLLQVESKFKNTTFRPETDFDKYFTLPSPTTFERIENKPNNFRCLMNDVFARRNL